VLSLAGIAEGEFHLGYDLELGEWSSAGGAAQMSFLLVPEGDGSPRGSFYEN